MPPKAPLIQPIFANALQDLAVRSGTDAVVVRGPRDLSIELTEFLQSHAPADFGRLEHLFHEVSSLVISEGALQTTTSQVFVLPLVPGRTDSASHREVLAQLVAGLLEAMRQRRVAEFCTSLGAEQMRLTDLKGGLLVTTLRRLNDALELKPNLAGVGLNLNAIIERTLGPATRPLPE